MKYIWFLNEKLHVVIGFTQTIKIDVTSFTWLITPTAFDNIPDNAIICDESSQKISKAELNNIIHYCDVWNFLENYSQETFDGTSS